MDGNKKTALVTGASSGIGKATAEALLQMGYTVYAAARRVEKMADLKERGAILLKMDVTSEDDLTAGIGQIEKEAGGVDVLINNAGFGLYGPMEELPMDKARYQFDVNIFGLARLTQLVLPYMRQQRAGKIVNVSSVGGQIYTPLGSWYHASKHALEGWSDCLRLELMDFGIDVIVIQPGAIQTDFGVVAKEGMQGLPQESNYGSLIKAMHRFMNADAASTGNSISSPSVIADLIVKAISTDKPKTRYVAGAFARPLLRMRRLFGDHGFDRMIMKVMAGR